jgi:coproporphyrinogen III oxidase-like Fe-S oxidoreductase
MSAARRYLEALFIEIDRRAVSAEFHGAPARTVYLGGGTPTILPRDWIAELLTRLPSKPIPARWTRTRSRLCSRPV